MTKDVSVALTFDFDAMSLWIGTFGMTSPSAVSRGEFGAIGVRRIMKTLEEACIPATFFVPGHTAYAFPKVVQAIAEAGHEIGHHGWVHENPVTVTAEREREIMALGLQALNDVVGIKPTGYRSPAWDNSPQTLELLFENGFEYESSMMGNDFQPYWCRVGDKWSASGKWEFGKPVEMVEIPVAWHLDDFPMFEYVPGSNQAVITPRQFLEMLKDEFDWLYEREGQGIFVPTMHPQVIGRGHRMIVLEQFIDYVKSKPGVKFTTMTDYARKWRKDKTPSLPMDAVS
ncbi:polysaccharide deacetylase [Tropicimonas sp. IMCC34043]|uniref:polysaccharide deacetylase family protein n=1 Tax=Tropicimonas sp. IMCC34043 TaxID=2248760 RepID=UPI000E25B0B7|nr:polysaccharide deacetylase [Tropicimonas sp. IMCC34043]